MTTNIKPTHHKPFVYKDCAECKGTGRIGQSVKRCVTCLGDGRVPDRKQPIYHVGDTVTLHDKAFAVPFARKSEIGNAKIHGFVSDGGVHLEHRLGGYYIWKEKDLVLVRRKS